MELGRTVEMHVAMIAEERVGIFYMVAMIVSQKYALDGRTVDTVMKELFSDVFAFNAGVDQHTSTCCADKGAVAAAAAAERNKSQGAPRRDINLGYVRINRCCGPGTAHDYITGDIRPGDVDVIKESGEIVEIS